MTIINNNELKQSSIQKANDDSDVQEIKNKISHNPKQFTESNLQQENAKNVIKHKSSMKIYLRCLIICMGSIYMGYNIGVLNLAFKKLEQVYQLEDNIALFKGILASSLLFGSTLGCFLAPKIIEKVGERNCAILCDIIAIILALFYLIEEYYVAMVNRFLSGIILGINIATVSPFIKAVSPTAILGKTGSFQSLFISTGVLIAVCIGQGFPIEEFDLYRQSDNFWRFALMFPIITCSIRLISFLFIYRLNTPIFYLLQNNEQKSKEALGHIYKDEFVNEQFEIIQHQVENLKKNQDTWSTVFSKSSRNKVELGCMMQWIFQLSGIMAIMLYSNTIFLKTTGDKQTSKVMNIGAAFCQAFPAFLSGELSKFHGRRSILLTGYYILVVILLILGTVCLVNKEDLDDEDVSPFSAYFTIGLVFLFCFVFRLSSGTVTWTYNAEILSFKGNALATSVFFFGAFIIGLIFPIGVEEFGIHTMFYLFMVTLIMGIIYLYPRVKETKGLSPLQIKQLFENNQNQKQTEKESQNTQEKP